VIRILHIAGVLALGAVCAVFLLRADSRSRADPQLEAVLNGPGAVERFRQRANSDESFNWKTAPLVVQAQALSRYLSPPKSPERSSVSVVSPSPAALAIRPAAPSVKFRLCATSYYPNQPGRSMALIGELDAAEGNERWVKEGTQVGHFIIHEIRRGVIVYRDGDNLREMAVERRASLPSIVRDLRPGSVRVSAAIGITDNVTPVLAGPNAIEITGGN
jgi:hypothetical protein